RHISVRSPRKERGGFFEDVALLPQARILPAQAGELISAVGPAAFARKRRLAEGLHFVLPLVQMVPAQAEFAGHRGRRTTGGLPESEGFQLELFGESLSFRHRTPPRGYCPLFEVSTKVGLAHIVQTSVDLVIWVNIS